MTSFFIKGTTVRLFLTYLADPHVLRPHSPSFSCVHATSSAITCFQILHRVLYFINACILSAHSIHVSSWPASCWLRNARSCIFTPILSAASILLLNVFLNLSNPVWIFESTSFLCYSDSIFYHSVTVTLTLSWLLTFLLSAFRFRALQP